MYMGEGFYLPKEQNSQVPEQAEPYMDTTLESPLNGRRRCTDGNILISQASGQRQSCIYDMLQCHIFIDLKPEYFGYSGFLFT